MYPIPSTFLILPIAEKMVLGMDFLAKHQAWIDVADGSITQVPTDNSG